MAIRKCADFAARNGYSVFAVFNGGMCRTGPTAHLTYSNAGPSRDCSYRGTGSKDASNVYTFSTGTGTFHKKLHLVILALVVIHGWMAFDFTSFYKVF